MVRMTQKLDKCDILYVCGLILISQIMSSNKKKILSERIEHVCL